jgi:hypothetical protein
MLLWWLVVGFVLEEDYCRLPYCRHHPLGSSSP